MVILSEKTEKYFPKYINKNRFLRTLGTSRPNNSEPKPLVVPVQPKATFLAKQTKRRGLFKVNPRDKVKISPQRQTKKAKKRLSALPALKLNLQSEKEKKEKVFGKRRIRTLKIQRSRDVLYSSV